MNFIVVWSNKMSHRPFYRECIPFYNSSKRNYLFLGQNVPGWKFNMPIQEYLLNGKAAPFSFLSFLSLFSLELFLPNSRD